MFALFSFNCDVIISDVFVIICDYDIVVHCCDSMTVTVSINRRVVIRLDSITGRTGGYLSEHRIYWTWYRSSWSPF